MDAAQIRKRRKWKWDTITYSHSGAVYVRVKTMHVCLQHSGSVAKIYPPTDKSRLNEYFSPIQLLDIAPWGNLLDGFK